MDGTTSKSCAACGPWWRLPLLLGLVLVVLLLTRGRGLQETTSQNAEERPTAAAAGDVRHSVSLTVDFGDERRREFSSLAWRTGMTVADLMVQADKLSTTQKGAGQSAFVTAIDGVANEGAAGRNWVYTVNGESADRSFAVYELEPGDRVLWMFAPSP
jgi:hypothetical protein